MTHKNTTELPTASLTIYDVERKLDDISAKMAVAIFRSEEEMEDFRETVIASLTKLQSLASNMWPSKEEYDKDIDVPDFWDASTRVGDKICLLNIQVRQLTWTR
jgi:hypothetical protein